MHHRHGEKSYDMKRNRFRALALVCALALVGAACGGDDDGDDSSTDTTEQAEETSSLLTDNGPCDEAEPKIEIGLITVIESPVLSLDDDATALEASVAAFNGRGGIGGRCMSLTVCDDEGDPNKEADCARQLVDKGVVATLSDVTSFNPQAVIDIFKAAGIPRIAVSPATQDLASDIAFPLDAGGVGTTFMMVPGCVSNGHTKIAAIHVDTPQIGPLFDALGGMLKAYGAEIVAKLPVSAGTTDFQQFTLAAKKAGATCAIIPLGENEAVQVLQAAQQLGTDLAFSGAVASFSRKSLQGLGDFAEQIYMNSAFPPTTADHDRWPIYKDVLRDLEASGEPSMEADEMKQAAHRSWFAVYVFQQIIEKFGDPQDVTRASVMAATKAAKDIDMFGVIPNWTPSATTPIPNFKAISNPWYYITSFKDGNFVVGDEQYHVINELIGQIEYPHDAEDFAAAQATSTTAAPSTTGG